MRTLKDNTGTTVTLSDESEAHIVRRHTRMATQIDRVVETVRRPDIVTPSKDDDRAKVFYRLYEDNKFICVVVKYLEAEAYISTAYETRNVR